MAKRLDLKAVNIYYGSFHAVGDVTLSILLDTRRKFAPRTYRFAE